MVIEEGRGIESFRDWWVVVEKVEWSVRLVFLILEMEGWWELKISCEVVEGRGWRGEMERGRGDSGNERGRA